MAIRRFSNHQVPQKNIHNIDKNLCLNLFINQTSNQLKANKLREFISKRIVLDDIPALSSWKVDLEDESMD